MRRAALMAVMTWYAAGCSTPFVVHGSRDAVRDPSAAGSPDEVFGETVRVTLARERYLGELIDCDGEGVYLRVHTNFERAWMRLAWSEVQLLEVERSSLGPAMLGWTIGGALSTITHGFWLLISGTVWAVTGGISTAVSWNPRHTVHNCDDARRFARFPQGMPPGFATRFGPHPEPERPSASPSGSPWSEPTTTPAPWSLPTPPR